MELNLQGHTASALKGENKSQPLALKGHHVYQTQIDYRRSSAAHATSDITESQIYPNLSERWNLKMPHQTGTCSEVACGYILHTYTIYIPLTR